MSSTITIAGRCSRCMTYVESTAGCQRCWFSMHSEAAESVLTEQEGTRIMTTPYDDLYVPIVRRTLDAGQE